MKRKTIVLLILLIASSFTSLPVTAYASNIDEDELVSNVLSDIENNDLSELLKEDTKSITQYSNLEEISSKENLEITKLPNYEHIKNSVIYDNVEKWLLNFSYLKVFSISFQQNKTGSILRYNCNETITLTLYAFFPVILEIYKNDSVSTDSYYNVITRAIVDENFKGRAGFKFEFDFEYFFGAKILMLEPKVGPGFFQFVFEKSWEYDTPLDGNLPLAKWSIPIPIPPVPVLGLAVDVEPTLDADFTAKLRNNNSDIKLSQTNLSWDKSECLQSFSAYIPEFYFEKQAIFDLFDFEMTITLWLYFYLKIFLNVPILKNFPIRFKLFGFPILPLVTLTPENVDIINIETAVTPSDKQPFIYGVDFDYSDSQGDNDGIIEPGETIDFSTYITNLGEGSAIAINTTASSDNVTVTGSDSVDLLLRERGNFAEQTGFEYTIPNDYTSNLIFVTLWFEYLAVNGSYKISSYEIIFRVVDSTDTYLEVTGIHADYLGEYWKSGEDITLDFLVTNRGDSNIEYAQLLVYAVFDTDITNPVVLTSTETNITTTTLAYEESAVLGSISLSAPTSHDDAIIFLYIFVYYEDATYSYIDPLNFAIPIFTAKPSFELTSAMAYETDMDEYFEAGETVEIEFTIKNIGDGNGYDITGYVTTDNPDLNFTNTIVEFDNLAPSQTSTSTKAILEIPLTANSQIAIFTLHIRAQDSNGNYVNTEFNITIEITQAPLPEITLLSYILDDSFFGNGNGLADPGEIIFLYVNIEIINAGFSLTGSMETISDLIIYNSTSFYGTLEDQTSSGDGFIIEIPLNYDGENAILGITISGESYAGDKVESNGFIDLPVSKGDLTKPVMTLLNTINTTVDLNEECTIRFLVEDPEIVGELESNLSTILLMWSFNGGEIEQSELTGELLDGEFYITLDTSVEGIYEFVIVGIDAAGNVEFLSDADNPYILNIVSAVSEYNMVPILSFVVVLIAITLISKYRRR